MLLNDIGDKLKRQGVYRECHEKSTNELHTELHFTKDMIKRKMGYAGHMLRGSSGLSDLQILEGRNVG